LFRNEYEQLYLSEFYREVIISFIQKQGGSGGVASAGLLSLFSNKKN